jgi:hypothetical protein
MNCTTLKGEAIESSLKMLNRDKKVEWCQRRRSLIAAPMQHTNLSRGVRQYSRANKIKTPAVNNRGIKNINRSFAGDTIYFTSTLPFNSSSTIIRPQFSQIITFLRCLISLCFCGGMALKQPPQASLSTGTTANPLR